MRNNLPRLIPALIMILLVAYVLVVVMKPEFFQVKHTSEKPKNVILMFADGYGPGALALYRGWTKLKTIPSDDFKYVSLMYTESKNNFVTDSAAAATALATSVSTNNRSVGVDSEGNPVLNISEACKKLGKSVGLISTNTVTDATPASFGAHTTNRWQQAELQKHYIQKQYDVILGGGRRAWEPVEEGGKRKDGLNVINYATDRGYTYVETEAELMSATGSKLLGLFHPDYMSFKVDREQGCMDEGSQEPSLKQMTMKAIEVLSKNPEGFFLLSEGARIDHAAHALDAHSMMYEVKAFYEAVEAVLTWAENRQDTLVIILSDHDTMGMMPTEFTRYQELEEIKCSTQHQFLQVKQDQDGHYNHQSIKRVLSEHGISNPTKEEIAILVKSEGLPFYKSSAAIGQIINERLHVGALTAMYNWKTGTGGHTSIPIPVFAKGPGAKDFTGVYHNTEFSKKLADLMGIHDLGSSLDKIGDSH